MFRENVEAFFAPYLTGQLSRYLDAHHPDARLICSGLSGPARDFSVPSSADAPDSRVSGRMAPVQGLGPIEIHRNPTGWLARITVLLDGHPPRQVAVLGDDAGRLLGAAWDPSGDALREVVQAWVAAEWAQAPADVSGMSTVLDLAWNRNGLPVVPIRTLDALRFRCHRSGNCCRSDWGVSVGDQTREAYQQVDWPSLLGPDRGKGFLVPHPGGDGHRLAARGSDCIFHDGDSCAVHAAIGTPFNPTCVTFPVTFTWTPDGPEASASFTCPSVLEGRGEPLEDRQDDLQARWWLWESEATRIPEFVKRCVDGEVVSYRVFRRFEQALLETLGTHGSGLHGRMRACLEAAVAFSGPGAKVPTFRMTESWAGSDGDGLPCHGLLDTFVFAASRLPRSADTRELPPGAAVRIASWIAAEGIRWSEPDERLVAYLRQIWFRKRLIPDLGVMAQVFQLPLCLAALRAIASWMAWSDHRDRVEQADVLRAVEALETLLVHGPGFARLVTGDRLLRPQWSDVTWARRWLAYAFST